MTMLEQGREHVAHLVKQKAPFAIGEKDISWREYAHRGGSTLIIKINGIDQEWGEFENLRLQTFYYATVVGRQTRCPKIQRTSCTDSSD